MRYIRVILILISMSLLVSCEKSEFVNYYIKDQEWLNPYRPDMNENTFIIDNYDVKSPSLPEEAVEGNSEYSRYFPYLSGRRIGSVLITATKIVVDDVPEVVNTVKNVNLYGTDFVTASKGAGGGEVVESPPSEDISKSGWTNVGSIPPHPASSEAAGGPVQRIGNLSTFVANNKTKTAIVYSQGAWGDSWLKDYGCGINALSMGITYVTGKWVTPNDIISMGQKKGGVAPNKFISMQETKGLASGFGLTGAGANTQNTHMSFTEYSDFLDKMKVDVMRDDTFALISGSNYSSNWQPFGATANHFVVVFDYDEKSDTYIIGNSASSKVASSVQKLTSADLKAAVNHFHHWGIYSTTASVVTNRYVNGSKYSN